MLKLVMSPYIFSFLLVILESGKQQAPNPNEGRVKFLYTWANKGFGLLLPPFLPKLRLFPQEAGGTFPIQQNAPITPQKKTPKHRRFIYTTENQHGT